MGLPTPRLLTFLCVATLIGLGSLRAQPAATSTPEHDPVKLADFAVTGSNIKGVDTEKSLPVTLYTAEDIGRLGVGTMAELVETMPFSSGISINETSTGPNDARGDVSTINLRNLGAGRTLVLVNGRRMSAYGVTPGTPPVQFVNINAIPLGAIQRVEVLRDGASAIYGSDAIGGVVNTILKQNYTASEVGFRYAAASGGLAETTASVAFGRALLEGRANLSLILNFSNRAGLDTSDRTYAADADKRALVSAPFNTNSAFNRRSSSGPTGRFTAVTDTGTGVSVPGITSSTGAFYYDPITGLRASGTGPTAFYNSQGNTQLIPDLTRTNLLLTYEHHLAANLAFFSEVSLYDSHSQGGFDAIPLSSTTDGVIIPKTNYYSPVGIRSGVATPRAVLIRNYRIVEAGPRSYDTHSDSARLLAGFRGDLGHTQWSWESALLYMRGHTKQVNHGYVSQSKFLAQLALDTPEAYNPFAPGSNSAAIVNNFLIDIWDDGVGTLSSWDARASGPVVTLPGGPLSAAVGAEVRRETMRQRNDPYGLADDVIAQSEQLDVSAGRNVASAYTEVLVPIVGDANRLPLVQALELRAAVRYERYSGFDALKPGVGLAWRPTSWLLLRASYNEGFRAPTVVELYTPAVGRRNEGFIDTARAGQPDAVSSVSKRVVTGGNSALEPEGSKSYNLGFVVDVPVLKGLSLGADLFRIRQRNQIDNADAQRELDLDASLWAASHGANPRVIRAAQTASDIAANLPGTLIEVVSTFQNLSLRETDGADAFLNYRTPQWALGRFDFTGALTYTRRLRSIDAKGNLTDLVRNDGSPRVRSTFGVAWSRRGWSASVQERYTSDYLASTTYTTSGQRFVIEPYWVTNASVSYRFSRGAFKGLRVRVGANNLFDRDPPFYPASSAGYDSYYADPRGRMAYVDLAYQF